MWSSAGDFDGNNSPCSTFPGGLPGSTFGRASNTTGPLDGIPFVVEQVLNLQHQLDVFAAVQPVALTGLLQPETWELPFPKTEYVLLDARKPTNLPDPEVELVRDVLLRGMQGRFPHRANIILMAILAGIHPVSEALRAGRPLDRVLIAKGAGGAKLQEVIELCRRSGIPVRFEPRDALDRVSGGATHQGVVALGSARSYVELSAVIQNAQMLVVLDGVEDPHNLGAIIRTVNAAGGDAVVIPERRAAGLTETVAKASAGAMEYTPVARIGNVSQALETLKEHGFWIFGLDERAPQRYDEADFPERSALVLGAEGKGLHEHVKKHCDVLLRIPMAGQMPR